jgi:hypothetical protein
MGPEHLHEFGASIADAFKQRHSPNGTKETKGVTSFQSVVLLPQNKVASTRIRGTDTGYALGCDQADISKKYNLKSILV